MNREGAKGAKKEKGGFTAEGAEGRRGKERKTEE
jgi:hypothetical protein